MTFRFAILHHLFPPGVSRAEHWDLLLELPSNAAIHADHGRNLLSFEVPTAPNLWGHQTECQRLPNHRNLYLDYEGEISGGRGQVTRVHSGTIYWQALETNLLVISLANLGVIQLIKPSIQPEDRKWVLEMQFLCSESTSPSETR